MPRGNDNLWDEQLLGRHRRYFEEEAGDFDAVMRDPSQARDPVRRIAYRFVLKTHRQNRRLSAVLSIARQHRREWRGARVLDLGCGTGVCAVELARMGAVVTMVDFSSAMLELARQNLAQAGLQEQVTLVPGDIRFYRSAGPVDLIVSTGVTDYIPKSYLGQIGENLASMSPRLVILSFPNYSFFSALRWLWLRTTRQLRLSYFRWAEIEAFASTHRFKIERRIRIPGYFVTVLVPSG